MKRRKFTVEYTGFRAAVISMKRTKYHPYKYEVVPYICYGVHENTVLFATDDYCVAHEYARLYGALY